MNRLFNSLAHIKAAGLPYKAEMMLLVDDSAADVAMLIQWSYNLKSAPINGN
jgi:hypothetical protein